MSNRKRTPDLLNQILTGQGGASDPASRAPDTSKSTSRQSSETTSQQTSKTVTGSSASEKIKGTYYLSPGGAEAIDDMWYSLRKLVAPENRGGISKSLIVDIAVQLALEEFEAEGRRSAIATRLGL